MPSGPEGGLGLIANRHPWDPLLATDPVAGMRLEMARLSMFGFAARPRARNLPRFPSGCVTPADIALTDWDSARHPCFL
jgi:hypothetical protein